MDNEHSAHPLPFFCSTNQLQQTQANQKTKQNKIKSNQLFSQKGWVVWVKAKWLLIEAAKVKKSLDKQKPTHTDGSQIQRKWSWHYLHIYPPINAYCSYAEYNMSTGLFISPYKHMQASAHTFSLHLNYIINTLCMHLHMLEFIHAEWHALTHKKSTRTA